MIDLLINWLKDLGLNAMVVNIITYSLLAVIVLLISFIVDTVAKRWIVKAINHLIRKSRITWDDKLIERKVFWRLSHVAPALVLYFSAHLFPGITEWLQRLALAYILVIVLMSADALLSALVDMYNRLDVSRVRPIKGYVQVIKIALFVVVGIFVLTILMDRSPWAFIGSLGALTAVLLLIFKDSILGLVAGIQLTVNNMVNVGDWIEMPRYGADGDVVEISLHTVKVQNWDKTFITIPAYSLISDSFKNWRGMTESGGRRIKRAINIDVNSIKFCTEEMLQRFEKFQYITEYIREKRKEIDDYNRTHGVDLLDIINRRRLTNIGTFRAYIVHYLRRHPKIHKDMTFLVRQLLPGSNGLPIEIYVFTNDTRWVEYEGIQSDIFDHFLAIVPEFDLRVFQNPSGQDFRSFAESHI